MRVCNVSLLFRVSRALHSFRWSLAEADAIPRHDRAQATGKSDFDSYFHCARLALPGRLKRSSSIPSFTFLSLRCLIFGNESSCFRIQMVAAGAAWKDSVGCSRCNDEDFIAGIGHANVA